MSNSCWLRISKRTHVVKSLRHGPLSLLLLSFPSRLWLASCCLSLSLFLSLVLSFSTSHFCHVFVKPRQNDLMYYEMYTKRSCSFSSSVPEEVSVSCSGPDGPHKARYTTFARPPGTAAVFTIVNTARYVSKRDPTFVHFSVVGTMYRFSNLYETYVRNELTLVTRFRSRQRNQ